METEQGSWIVTSFSPEIVWGLEPAFHEEMKKARILFRTLSTLKVEGIAPDEVERDDSESASESDSESAISGEDQSDGGSAEENEEDSSDEEDDSDEGDESSEEDESDEDSYYKHLAAAADQLNPLREQRSRMTTIQSHCWAAVLR